jgi:hypothetical protein
LKNCLVNGIAQENQSESNMLLYNLTEEELSALPFHINAKGIKRLVAQGLPVHLGVHLISESQSTPQEYTSPHAHESPEVNIILSEKDRLVYLITVGEEEFRVESPAAVWIPKDVLHSAKFLEGSGSFICVVLEKEYNAINEVSG